MNAGATYAGGPAQRTVALGVIAVLTLAFLILGAGVADARSGRDAPVAAATEGTPVTADGSTAATTAATPTSTSAATASSGSTVAGGASSSETPTAPTV